jgi:hypothetical protein
MRPRDALSTIFLVLLIILVVVLILFLAARTPSLREGAVSCPIFLLWG